MNIFDKLLLLIVQLLGENNFTSYIKGLLLSYSYLLSIESGKINDFSKIDLLLEKYLTSFVKPKIKNRIRLHKLIYQALNFAIPQNLNFLVETEINNLTFNDKVLLIKEYLKVNIMVEQTSKNIIKLLNSISKKELNKSELVKLNNLENKLQEKLNINLYDYYR
ncbi:MAG: hypothetical protein KatS3mg068_2251 [Candidatus Sericytochromatia bacterium]|nr:MAG: hypothetical protein KatS3mg068_2251 [Candidatus Sericytochromatia bacterium]